MKVWFLTVPVVWLVLLGSVVSIESGIIFALISFIFGSGAYLIALKANLPSTAAVAAGWALMGPILFALLQPLLPGHEPVRVTITLPAEAS